MPRVRGWIAKRFATRLFVTMPSRPPKGYSPRRLTADEEAALAAVIIAGPDERDGVCAWTRADLCRWLEERFAKTYHPSSDPGSTADGIFPPEGAPEPPAKGRRSAGALQKRGLRDILKATAAAHPDKRLQLWFQDEARVGNKGRVCHRWWRRGERAPGTRQIGYQWAYIFSAVRPDTGDDVTLVMPSVNAKVMDLFLAHFADTLDQDAHAVMMCDGAGWHDERALTVPDNVTLALLPPYSPELNPVERVWLYLRERFLSLRVLDDTEAIIDACCQAWIDLIAEPDRMRTLCAYPWIMKVIS